MRYAIFSDIHNHTAALQEVLQHAGQQRVDQYFCLGDVGIDECVNLVRAANASTVFGNWEVSGWRYLSPDNQKWLLELPPIRREAQFWLTHAAPLWPDRFTTLSAFLAGRHFVPISQLFPYMHYESEALWETLALLSTAGIPLLFHGHTHRQLAWCFSDDNRLQKVHQRSFALQPGQTWVVGVGSVGRPLDGPHPAYVIYDAETSTVELMSVT